MAQERAATPLAPFVKFVRPGYRALGRIAAYGENDNGPFVTLRPALWKTPGKEAERHDELAVGLTADLKSKITPSDVGRMFIFALIGERGSAKGKPTKIFKVVEVDRGDDFVKMIADDTAFPPPPKDALASGSIQDDLPF